MFTGQAVHVECIPKDRGGIVFFRTDLDRRVSASLHTVSETPRRTILHENGTRIQTPEHLLAALWLLGIPDVHIRMDAEELPILDGSARDFLDALRIFRNPDMDWIPIERPLMWQAGRATFEINPSDQFRVDYTLIHPDGSEETATYEWGREPSDIADARTFAWTSQYAGHSKLPGFDVHSGFLIDDAEWQPDDALVRCWRVAGRRIHSVEPPRFEAEAARHKILDLIGDLSLMGVRPLCHIRARGTGHAENIRLAWLLAEARRIAVS